MSACLGIRQSDKSVNNKALAASLFACTPTALPLLISSSRLCFSSHTRHSSVSWINPAYALFPSFIPSPIQSPMLLQWSIPQFPFPSSLSSPSSVWGTSRDIRKDVSSCSHPESKEWTRQSKPVKSAGIAHLPVREIIRDVLNICIDTQGNCFVQFAGFQTTKAISALSSHIQDCEVQLWSALRLIRFSGCRIA